MIRSFGNLHPRITATAYVDESAQVIGDVVIGEHASVWPGAVLRGDIHSIRIGEYTNIQDNCVVHVEEGLYPVVVEDHVTVGHGVILHGCHIEPRCLIAMGAIMLNDVRIGTGSIVAAGAIIAEHTKVPPGSLVMGVPGKVRRGLTEDDFKRIDRGADAYFRLKERFLAERQSSCR
jgi:carbonic anhydrase/acetyltransferase-like protein (isoleucine patch superfamily)